MIEIKVEGTKEKIQAWEEKMTPYLKKTPAECSKCGAEVVRRDYECAGVIYKIDQFCEHCGQRLG